MKFRDKINTLVKIHDNGGRPFTVKISPERIDIYVLENNKYKYFKSWRNYFDIWIGEDECDKNFSYGNSVLVQLNKNRYLFIGMEIVEFTFDKKIDRYFSPVGNNDVPYPWFSDKENNVYILSDPNEIESFPVDKNKLKTFGNCASSSLCDRSKCNKSDPYKELWKNKSVPENTITKIKTNKIHSRV